mmetsp:Transcript_31189/g.74430  ORF Transcript_31189/g.74430 Transcript_31189/m.74430 type:complete len:229 (+) Transcript_31189:2322-3008(+)
MPGGTQQGTGREEVGGGPGLEADLGDLRLAVHGAAGHQEGRGVQRRLRRNQRGCGWKAPGEAGGSGPKGECAGVSQGSGGGAERGPGPSTGAARGPAEPPLRAPQREDQGRGGHSAGADLGCAGRCPGPVGCAAEEGWRLGAEDAEPQAYGPGGGQTAREHRHGADQSGGEGGTEGLQGEPPGLQGAGDPRGGVPNRVPARGHGLAREPGGAEAAGGADEGHLHGADQ